MMQIKDTGNRDSPDVPIADRSQPRVRVLVVDDEEAMRGSLCALLEAGGYEPRAFRSAGEMRASRAFEDAACMLVDVRLGEGIDGIDLMAELRREGMRAPVIVITGHADVPLAVRAMREGAADFIEKPFSSDRLLDAITQALAAGARTSHAAQLLARLTARERQVLDGLATGQPNKAVARDLGISVRTVEAYRATIMAKLNATSLADLVRLHLVAGGNTELPGAV